MDSDSSPNKPTVSNHSNQRKPFQDASDSWEKVTSEFVVPSSVYKGLDIEQKTSKYINFQVGQANISVDDSLDESTVRFDMFFADPKDKNLIEIHSKKKSGDLLRLELELKQRSFFTYKRIDVKLDVTVKLSSASALDILVIALPNEIITINGNHSPVFSHLVLKTDNGRITTSEFITAGIVVLSTTNGGITARGLRGKSITLSAANGYIDVGIDDLSGKLIGAIADGKIDINVASITGKSSTVGLSATNGNVSLSLPDTLESSFQIKTVIGGAVIQSNNHPEKIHYKGALNTHHINGYYGNTDQQTGNNTNLSTIVGQCSLTFV